ncbi:tyrosine-type recombinase/integrase [Cellulosimicrobium cellulans]|uniref:tyrosine-type recombinase/integrase n=1 Tax=Cellulosimicrobium cellulans TaxID=1710 RepID=UPI0035D62CE5
MVADNSKSRRGSVVGFAPVGDEVLASGEQTAAAYVRYLERSGLAETSIASYSSKVRLFAAWLDEQPHHRPAEVFTDPLARDHALRDYRAHLLGTRGLAPTSVDASLAAIDGFTTWLGLGLANVKRVSSRGQGRYGKHLTDDQARAMWRAAEKRSARDLAIVMFMLGHGLRIGEVHSLDVDDYVPRRREHNEAGQRLTVIGKGTKARDIYLTVRHRAILNDWYDERRGWKGAADPAMFLSVQGGRLATRSIRHVIYEVSAAAGIDRVNPHLLRHTTAHGMLAAGSVITEVQQQLGHSSLATTALYTQPTEAERAAAIERAEVDW